MKNYNELNAFDDEKSSMYVLDEQYRMCGRTEMFNKRLFIEDEDGDTYVSGSDNKYCIMMPVNIPVPFRKRS